MTFSAGPYRSSLPTGAIGDLPVAYPRTGKTFWVNNSTVLPDSGIAGSDSNPGTYLKPFSTLDYAVGRCTAGRGDVIYIMPGYTQTMTAADDVDVDVAGVSVIGLGRGDKRPTFTYTVAAGEFVIGADQVHIENLKFVPSVTGVTHAIDVESGSIDCEIVNCEFSSGVTVGTDEFNAAITVVDTADHGLIQGCYFDAQAAGAIYAVSLNTPVDWRILDNVIVGVYSTGCIGTITGAGAGVNQMFRNVVVNGEAGALGTADVFTQSAAGNWMVGSNMFATNDATSFVAMFTNYTKTINMRNMYTDDSTMVLSATQISASIAISADT